jgi:hypothetical protein
MLMQLCSRPVFDPPLEQGLSPLMVAVRSRHATSKVLDLVRAHAYATAIRTQALATAEWCRC